MLFIIKSNMFLIDLVNGFFAFIRILFCFSCFRSKAHNEIESLEIFNTDYEQLE